MICLRPQNQEKVAGRGSDRGPGPPRLSLVLQARPEGLETFWGWWGYEAWCGSPEGARFWEAWNVTSLAVPQFIPLRSEDCCSCVRWQEL